MAKLYLPLANEMTLPLQMTLLFGPDAIDKQRLLEVQMT